MRSIVAAALIVVVLPCAALAQTFGDAKITLQEGDKNKQLNAAVQYDTDAFVVLGQDKKPLKTFPYSSITGAEYSYAKSPRWKTAIFVSPFFLFTSGKQHWFLAKAGSDFAMLRLDKSNYRMVLATFEAKTGKKVELIEDQK